MHVSAFREIVLGLDRAYEGIDADARKSGSAGSTPASASFVHKGERPRSVAYLASSGCDKHGGARHGFDDDPLANALAQEMATWVALAKESPTARSILGVESIDSAPKDGRLGTLVSWTGGGDFDVRLAASGGLVTPNSTGGGLWAPAPKSLTGDCPPPRLLDPALAAGGPDGIQRVPFGYSETWLSVDPAEGGDRFWSEPCEACQSGLSTWLCGQDETRLTAGPEARAAYARLTAEWKDFLRDEGSATRRKLDEDKRSTKVAVPADITPAEKPPSPAPTAALPSIPQPAQTGTLASQPAPTASLPDEPPPSRPDGFAQAAAEAQKRRAPASKPGPGAPRVRRDRVRVRLDSQEFPCDDIEIRELTGKEALSKLFSFLVDIVCPEALALDPHAVLGASVSLVFEQGPEEVRRVHGMVAQIDDRFETESEWRSYRLWIVPRVWRSTLVETQEVYLDIDVPALILQKLALVGLDGDAEMRLRGAYAKREIIVQYKETDVAFFSRLAEHLGVHFFFEHESGADKIIFADDNSAFRPLENAAQIPYRTRGEKIDVFELVASARAFPASFAVQDYNYRTPTVDLTGMFEAKEGFAGGVIEHGTHHKTPAEGAVMARVRAEERTVANRYYTGKSDVAELQPGGTFGLVGHPRLEGLSLAVVEVEHRALQTVKMQGAEGGDEPYRNTFRAIEAHLPYRPPRATPRPKIHGLVTGIVAPYQVSQTPPFAKLDEQGRYIVRLLFDAGATDERRGSHPMRMLQKHAGANYGTHFPLKPGIEVLVAFVDGDPDRPLIVGAVPNPITPSPVVTRNHKLHRIVTETGIQLVFKDA